MVCIAAPELSSQTVVTNNEAISSLSLDVEEATKTKTVSQKVGSFISEHPYYGWHMLKFTYSNGFGVYYYYTNKAIEVPSLTPFETPIIPNRPDLLRHCWILSIAQALYTSKYPFLLS